jgi:hypothetical protein
MYERMKKLERLSPRTRFLYWIKNFLVSRLRAQRFEELYGMAERGEEYPSTFSEVCEELVKI